ncbi:MAG: hypothetical protein ACKPKO_51365, partial [Candidatus Fonsibacter sp.]
ANPIGEVAATSCPLLTGKSYLRGLAVTSPLTISNNGGSNDTRNSIKKERLVSKFSSNRINSKTYNTNRRWCIYWNGFNKCSRN